MTDKPQRPDMVAYVVRDRDDGKKSSWKEIGVAFGHKDSQGFDVLLDALPTNGRLTLRILSERETERGE